MTNLDLYPPKGPGRRHVDTTRSDLDPARPGQRRVRRPARHHVGFLAEGLRLVLLRAVVAL